MGWLYINRTFWTESFGLDADSFSKEQESSKSVTSSSATSFSLSVLLNSTWSSYSRVQDVLNVETDTVLEEDPIKQSSSEELISEENQSPMLIDNKRKHWQKALSAAQIDWLFLQEVKDDAQYC